MTMSSKRAGQKAMSELIDLIGIAIFGPSQEVVFRSYQKMTRVDMPASTYAYKLRKLERHGLLSRKRTPAGHVFIITAKAKALRRRAVVKKPRADGLATLIIFDIPEDKHNARDTLRRFLLRNGYTRLRESCFISPYLISGDLVDLVKELKLEQNVSFFASKVEYPL